jgi:PAS domain S-box-containing protein
MRMAVLAILVLAPLVAAFWLQVNAGQDLESGSGDLRSAQTRLLVSADLGRRVVDVETALRGFALTGDSRFIGPRDDAEQIIPRLELRLRNLEQADGRPADRLLHPLFDPIDRYMREYADPLLAALRAHKPSARSVATTLEGKRRVDVIRARLNEFTRTEQLQVRMTADRADDSAHRGTLIATIALISIPLLFLLAAFLASRYITRPVRRLEDAADRLRQGELDVRVPPGGTGEIAHLGRSFNEMAASLQSSVARTEAAARLNRAMLEASHDGYLAVDEDGVVLAFTARAAIVFGFPAHEILGHVLADVVLPDPAEREAHHQRRRRLLAAGTAQPAYRVFTTRKDGRRVLLEISSATARAPDGRRMGIYFVRDVTDEERRERERRAEEAIRAVLVRAAQGDDLVLPIIGALGEALGCLRGTFWEFDEAEQALRCTQIWNGGEDMPEVDRVVLEARFRPGAHGGPFRIPLVAWETGEVQWNTFENVPPADEAPDPVAVAEAAEAFGATQLRSGIALPVTFAGTVLGVIGLGTPDTEEPDETRWLALRSIADLVGQILGRRRAEQEVDRQKNEFFALVSHELRTPLTSVIGYLDMTLDEEAGPLNETQRQFLDVVDRNAHRLQRLVGDLLFMAQIESGDLSLELVPTSLDGVVTDGVEAARPRAVEGEVTLTVDAEPIRLDAGDGDRLGQLVDNLLSNAIKFTPAGGTITVRLERDGDAAVLEIADTGPGISKADLDHVFERFYRAEEARRSIVPGLGLGLSISHAIVAGHHGTLDLESQPGRGTTVRVRLPIHAAAPAATGS